MNSRPFPFSFISNLTFVRDPVSLLVFHGPWSNSCNMEEVEEVEEVIEPTTELNRLCRFFYEEGKGGKTTRSTSIKTNLGVGSNKSKKCPTKLRESV